jgi:hypothetical protein
MPTSNTDGTSLTDVTGYQILYGTSPSALDRQLAVSGASVTTVLINGLSAGTHYFSVRTINASGSASISTSVVTRNVP